MTCRHAGARHVAGRRKLVEGLRGRARCVPLSEKMVIMKKWEDKGDENATRHLHRRRLSAWRIRVILAALAVVLFAGNPGPRQFARMVVAKTATQQTSDPNTFVINLFPSVARALVLANSRRSNFYLFSVYRIRYGEHDSATYFAAMWSIVRIGVTRHDDNRHREPAHLASPASTI